MKTIFTTCLLLCLGQHAFSTIVISFVAPTNNQIVTTTSLSVSVSVSSGNDLASVIATVGTSQSTLIYNTSTHYFQGSVSLSGLPQDTLQLQITATDIYSNQQTATQKFIYDLPPAFSYDLPLSESVARTNINYKIRNLDGDSSNFKVEAVNCYAGAFIRLLYQGVLVDSFQATFGMSPEDGKQLCIRTTLTDKRGVQNQIYRSIYVTSNPSISEVFANKYKIDDFNYNKLLSYYQGFQDGVSRDELGTLNREPHIVDINTGTDIMVPEAAAISAKNGFLTPFGAMYQDYQTAPVFSHIYDWNNGILSAMPDTAANTGTDNLSVAGNFASWTTQNNYYRRNLLTKTNTIVGPTLFGADINDSGRVSYSGLDYNIYTDLNGVKTKITNDGPSPKENVNSVSSGNYILYKKANSSNSSGGALTAPFQLYLYDGQSHSMIVDWGTLNFSPLRNYRVNNKFIAYTKLNLTNQQRIWLKDSAGFDRQISLTAGSTYEMLALNSRGDVWYTTQDSIFARFITGQTLAFSKFTQSPYGIGGQPYYRDSTWYLAVGRMLYKINTGAEVQDLCPSGDSVVLHSSLVSTAYQWQVNTGSGFNNIADNINYSGANSANLIIKNIPSGWYDYQYRCITVDGSSFGRTFSLHFSDQWTGSANTLWENPANWSCGTVPDSNTDVIVNSGTLVINSNVIIRSLKLSPGANLTVATGYTLTVLH